MKQSDKEFLCYLICLSWDRLDDAERIRASKIIREITNKEDNLPADELTPDYMTLEKVKKLDAEYIVEEKGKELYRVSLPESPDGRIYSSGNPFKY